MLYLLAVICILILYGSLAPWHFRGGWAFGAALRDVFHAWPGHFGLSELKDFIINVVLYAPVGFLGYLCQRPGFSLWRAGWPVLLGGLLSLLVETLQHYVPGRFPSRLDLAANTLGALAGVVVALLFEATLRARWREVWHRQHVRPSSALVLLLLWSAFYMMPLDAMASGFTMKVRSLLRFQGWNWWNGAAAVLIWLTLRVFLEAIFGRKLASRFALLLAAFLFGWQMLAPGRSFGWSDCAGAALGLLLGACFKPELLKYPLAFLWVAWIALDGLQPFRWMAPAHAFNWLPFRDLINSSWMEGLMVLFRKLAVYGTALWCLDRTGVRVRYSLPLVLVVVSLVEAAQRYLPGRTASISDILLVILVSALLSRVERKYEAR